MTKIKLIKLFGYSFKLWADCAMPKMSEDHEKNFQQPKQKIHVLITKKGNK